ncbi:MAG TPA: AarF/ABC1/UbiB kinase family protein [Oxalobacteraceae bacterium]|nr:AarF/ABC1/UbiB kinase family protein [Oxalobacteraceae bacterium]
MHVLVRLWQVNIALWGYLAWLSCVRARLIKPRLSPALRFAAMLESLGTTFVKLGQGLSLHSELLPDDYIAALQKLQDHVGPFSGDLAREEIARSLNLPLSHVFAQFDAQPLAAGSIAQVHKAVLMDGRTVIVKVRRPGIKRQVEEDVRILRWVVRSVLFALPRFRRVAPLDLIDELSRNLHKEIAFRQEAANIARFVELFRDSPTIFVPVSMQGLCSDWVLVQEMSMGRRIDDPVFLADGPRLAQNLVDAYVHQFFVAGVFHGDPHPGNLFVLSDGRICMHDFGLIGFLDQATRANLVAFMQAFVKQDGEWLLDACLDLGILSGKLDRVQHRAGLEELIQDYAHLPLRDWSFGEAFIRIARMGKGQHVRIPHHLLVLLRAVFLMESTVRKLDPEFNLLAGLFAKASTVLKEAVHPDFDELAARIKYESLISLKELPAGISRMMHRLRSEGLVLSFHHAGLDEMRNEVKHASNKISLALITLGLYIAASLLMQHSIGPRIAGMPVLAAFGYGLALWLTLRVVRSATKNE